MRLRFARVHKPFPPLQQTAVTLRREVALGNQPLALHFLIGVNGTGKTRFLQAIAEVFLALECDHAFPAFPVWLAYDRRLDGELRTIYLRHPSQPDSHSALIVFEEVLPDDVDWDFLHTIDPISGEYPYRVRTPFVDNLPGSGAIEAFLPSPLLVYTSGFTGEWDVLFAPRLVVEESAPIEISSEDERPAGWDVARENEYLRQSAGNGGVDLPVTSPEALATQLVRPEWSLFVSPEQLPLAACAFLVERANDPQAPDLDILMSEVRWRAPVAVNLRIAFRPELWGRDRANKLSDLLQLTSAVVRDPEPGVGRQLVFDLERPTPEGVIFKRDSIQPGVPTGVSLMEVLGGDNPSAFDVFRTLREWLQDKLLLDVKLAFKKSGEEDVLLYDWLSDGERMLLGRMALFHLLRQENDALIFLDEPETHFNDAWKRDLVNIIEQALTDTYNHIVLTTHSSLTVTDAYRDEVILFTPAGPRRTIRTLGAEPGELLQAVFDQAKGVGERAVRRIEGALEKGDRESLEAILTKVGPGNYRYIVVEKLQDVSQDQPS